MTLPIPTGRLDSVSDTVFPPDATVWSELDTWNTYPQWALKPAQELTWLCEMLDLEQVRTFNLIIECLAQGQASYEIFMSNTGEFLGEENSVIIAAGSQQIPSFTARYVVVSVTVTRETGIPQLQGILIRTSDQSNTLTLSNVDTSTLSGTVAARVLALPKNIGGVKNMQITVKSVPDYTLDVYVTDWPTSNTVIPRIVDRSPPTIALVGLDNQPRDAVVDVKIDYLAENYMSGNNLLIR